MRGDMGVTVTQSQKFGKMPPALNFAFPMARQLEDNQTLDLLPLPKKRGRPKTGKAMTPAQKQAAYRRRKKLFGIAAIELDRTDASILISALRSRQHELARQTTQNLFETAELIEQLCDRLMKLHD